MKIKIHKKLTIPKTLFYRIEKLNLTKIQKERCYSILYILTSKAKYRGFTFEDWRPLSSSYLRLVIGNHYLDYINILGEAGIIDCDELFYEGKALCYRVNSSVNYEEELCTLDFDININRELSNIRGDRNESYRFLKSLQELNIDYNKLEAIAEKAINNISIKDFTANANLHWKGGREVEFVSGNISYSAYLKRDAAVREAEASGRDMIRTDSGIKIIDVNEFINRKKISSRVYYKNVIEAIKDPKTIYAKRNDTNRRLDTNFTNLPSKLLEEIYLQNDILEIDSVNSQPALLAYILETEGVVGDDVDVFIETAYNGCFYEYLSNKLGVDRSRAKNITFEVLFSSSRINSDDKALFQATFPIVWEYIKHIKTSAGDKDELSVKLQRLEAEIFIDKILNPLMEKGYKLFSKHDSIACYAKDYSEVYSHITEVYDSLGFRGTLKTK